MFPFLVVIIPSTVFYCDLFPATLCTSMGVEAREYELKRSLLIGDLKVGCFVIRLYDVSPCFVIFGFSCIFQFCPCDSCFLTIRVTTFYYTF